MLAAAMWTVVGLVGGSFVTWLVSRHYYLRASRERPEWASELVGDVVRKYEGLHPNVDPGDLVAVFEEALQHRGIVLDGGTF